MKENLHPRKHYKICLIHDEAKSHVAAMLQGNVSVELTKLTLNELRVHGLGHTALQKHKGKANSEIFIFEGDDAAVHDLETLDFERGFFDVIVSRDSGARLARFAVQNAVADYLSWPIAGNLLLETIGNILTQRNKTRALNTQRDGKITAIMGCKGGIGSSFLAYQLSQLLAEEERKKTLLLDFDLQYSSATTYCDTQPEHSVLQALHAAIHLDALGLNGYVHRLPCGLGLLACDKLESPLVEDFPTERVEMFLNTCKALGEHILVDLPPTLNLFTLSTLQHAQHVFLVVEQSIPALSQAVKQLKILREELHLNSHQISVIVNRYASEKPITLNDINETLKIEHAYCVPEHAKICARVIEQTKPIHQLAPRHGITKSLAKIARDIHNPQTNQASLFGRFTGLFKGAPVEASS